MSASLPAALQAAAARFTDDVPPKELAARTAALTHAYRGGGTSHSAIADDRDIAAYLTARLPATYAAMTAALTQVKARAPGFAPESLLDAGSGPGTASWAAAELWPQLESVTMLDRNPHLLSAARRLAGASDRASLANAQFISGDLHVDFPPPFTGEVLAKRAEGGRYDLVLAAYAFAELPAHKIAGILNSLWTACRGVLVIVEPGTPASFARILACRTALIAAGARIAAPCPAAYRCPIVSPDWCHFAERLPRTRAHMRAKAASVPFEDEKFSYLAVAREGIELAPLTARIIAPPHLSKPDLRLRLCSDGRIAERTVLKRDKPAYKAVSRKRWGDVL